MRPTLAALVLALAAADAGAAVLYKLVDPVGNVTFTDAVPRDFAGSVTRMEVDTGSNLIAPRPAEPIARSPAVPYEVLTRRAAPSGEERLRVAAQRVEDARQALQSAQDNSLAEDWIYLGSGNPLGMRRMPRPEYQARLQALAGELVAAEAAYDALRSELR